MFRAVLIGIDSYEDPSFQPLKYATADVEELQQLLIDSDIGGFSPENVAVLKDVTYSEISKHLNRVLDCAAAEDLVFTYFAGHSRTDKSGHLCLVTRNTDAGNLVGTSVHLNMIRAMWQNSPAKKLVLVLDSCYSGAAGELTRGELPTASLDEMSGEGQVVISSCKGFQLARERDDVRHGIFAHHFLHGLRTGEADDNHDDWIDIGELYSYVYNRMKEEKIPQIPTFSGSKAGEIIIAKSIAAVRAKKAEKQQVEEKKNRLFSWWDSSLIPSEIYNRSLQLLDLEPSNVAEKDAKLLRLTEEVLEGRLDIQVFVDTWSRVEKPERKDEARMAFELAQRQDSKEAWEEYLKRYKGIHKRHDEEARRRLETCERFSQRSGRREETDFAHAQEENTAQAWQMFLQTYPESTRKQEALKQLDALAGRDRAAECEKAFEESRQLDTSRAWHEYLEKWRGTFPEHDVEAEKRLQVLQSSAGTERQAYEAARRQGTLESWVQFLQHYPDSDRRSEVLGRISSLLHPSPGLLAPASRRVIADFIDFACLLLILVPITLVYTSSIKATPVAFVGLLATILTTSCLYFAFIPSTKRTLGHQLMGTFILNKQQKPLGYLRTFGYVGIWLLWWVVWLFVGVSASLLVEEVGGSDLATLVVLFFFLVGPFVGTAIFVRNTSHHQALYDLVAGTLVVQRPRPEAVGSRRTNYARPGRRFLADFVDAASLFMVGGALARLFLLLVNRLAGGLPSELDYMLFQYGPSTTIFSDPMLLGIFVCLWLTYYSLAFRRFGQTLGAHFLGFRYVNKSHGVPSWSNVIRYAACMMVALMFTVFFVVWVLAYDWELAEELVPWLPPGELLVLPLLVFLLNPVLVHFKKRSAFDFLSGTKALRVQKQTG